MNQIPPIDDIRKYLILYFAHKRCNNCYSEFDQLADITIFKSSIFSSKKFFSYEKKNNLKPIRKSTSFVSKYSSATRGIAYLNKTRHSSSVLTIEVFCNKCMSLYDFEIDLLRFSGNNH